MSTNPLKQRVGVVALSGVRLAWRETAVDAHEDVPVVALHGMCSTAATWDQVAARLAGQGRRTIALDLRGHGGSSRPGSYTCAAMRDDVLAFLDDRGLQQVDLLGHSLGGHVAMLLAQHSPHRVRRLVVEDASPPPASMQDSALRTRRQRAALTGQSLLLLSRARRFDVRMVRPVLTEVLRTPDPAWWAALPHVAAPTLLVGGGRTSHVSTARQQRVADRLPSATLVLVAEAGHRVHSKHLERFCDFVLPTLTS
ncbi:alpha/beta fold hydrolase [Aquipuribacter hungaricus]|uniref:alpha/beta fold hydrolase n=1 Tax=Aquipuribacter hungaricus TaxID=545624 RepID=UPI0030ED2160